MPRRYRPPPTRNPGPSWLERLREAVFAALPEVEEHWTYDDETYRCQRTLDDTGGRLVFSEYWLDPRTYQVQKAWSAEIEAGCWVGPVAEPIFQQQLTVLLQGLTQLRPQRRQLERLPVLYPGRFAHDPQRRHLRWDAV
jgi:hypothetical protein